MQKAQGSVALRDPDLQIFQCGESSEAALEGSEFWCKVLKMSIIGPDRPELSRSYCPRMRFTFKHDLSVSRFQQEPNRGKSWLKIYMLKINHCTVYTVHQGTKILLEMPSWGILTNHLAAFGRAWVGSRQLRLWLEMFCDWTILSTKEFFNFHHKAAFLSCRKPEMCTQQSDPAEGAQQWQNLLLPPPANNESLSRHQTIPAFTRMGPNLWGAGGGGEGHMRAMFVLQLDFTTGMS